MKPLKILLPIILGLGLALLGSRASAGESVGSRKIVSLGCHNSDGTCYVTLDGSSFGSTLGCTVATYQEFRFDNGDTVVGKRTYASLLAAFFSGRYVSVYLDGCTSQGFPKLIYFQVNT